MKKIDCLGEVCPLPAVRLKKEIKAIKQGMELLVVTDHGCALNSIKALCQVHHLKCTSNEVMNGIWEVTITNK